MMDEKSKIVRVIAIDDKSVTDRVSYVRFVVKVLGMYQAIPMWLNDGEKDYLCLIPNELAESKSIEELNNLLKTGEYVDFTPNKERLKFFKTYCSILRYYSELLTEIRENILRIIEAIEQNIEQIWKPCW